MEDDIYYFGISVEDDFNERAAVNVGNLIKMGWHAKCYFLKFFLLMTSNMPEFAMHVLIINSI